MVSEVRSKTESFETWCLKNVEEFSNYANTVVNGITSVYLPQNNVLTEPDDIEEAPKIPETLSIHIVVRGFNEDGICYFKFYFLSKDREPFSKQYYRKEDDLRFVAMNCYRFRSTPMKLAHFAKESMRANWNGSNVVFVSNGFMNIVSISDLLFIYLDTSKILSFKLNWNLFMPDFLNSRLFYGRFLWLYFVKDDWIEDIMGFSQKIYIIIKYIFHKI